MSIYKLIFIYTLGLVGTAVGLVAGAPFFKVFYQHTRPYYFIGLWLATLGLAFGANELFFAASLLVVGVLILTYEGAGVLKRPFVARVFWALTASFGVAGVGTWWALRQDTTSLNWILNTQQSLRDLQQFEALSQLNPEFFLLQLPSGLFIVLMLALFVSLMVEKNKAPLYEYSNPGFMIWIFLASMVGSFIDWPLGLGEMGAGSTGGAAAGSGGMAALSGGRLLASNSLNIVLMCYFFQGLAVVSVWLRRYKVGLFYRVFLYIFIVLQLLLVVSMLGVMDYWLDFRRPRLKRPRLKGPHLKRPGLKGSRLKGPRSKKLR